MKAFATIVVVAAGCGDPNLGLPCQPGHARATDTSGCYVATAAIAIDGNANDWTTVPPIALAPACRDAPCGGLVPTELRIAAGGDGEGDADVFVLARFGAPPPTSADLRVVLSIAASPQRAATAGVDRLIGGTGYEKNGFAVTSNASQWAFAATSDGFEAWISGPWLPYQGTAQISVAIERDHGGTWVPVAPSDPLDTCWGWRSDPDGTLGVHACEAR